MNRADTATVLDLVAQHDCREITPDEISDWHYHIGHLTRAVAEEAVTIHHKTNPQYCTPHHVLDIAEQIHQRKPSHKPARRARMGAYQVTGAINYPCDKCGAEPGETCTNSAGQETAAPCVTRLLGRPIREPSGRNMRGAA